MGLLDFFDQFTVDNANAPGPKSRTGVGTIDRKLGERSYLDFEFPEDREGGPPLSIRLPFLENIVISEKKRARYQKYRPVSRSSELYTYLGADSRKLNLTFSLSLKHIEAAGPDVLDYMNFLTEDSYEKVKDRFKKQTVDPPKSQAGVLSTAYLSEVQDVANNVIQNWMLHLSVEELTYLNARYGLADLDAPFPDDGYSLPYAISDPYAPVQSSILAIDNDRVEQAQNELVSAKSRVIDMVIYWVNLVRSSVVNNALDPTLGPPIVRLNHGIMYQDVPCVCTNYSIEADKNAPLDIDTLLPQRINFVMSLEELRTGNFGKFRGDSEDGDAYVITRDNLAGWEAVITQGTMDPGTTLDSQGWHG